LNSIEISQRDKSQTQKMPGAQGQGEQ